MLSVLYMEFKRLFRSRMVFVSYTHLDVYKRQLASFVLSVLG